MAKRNGGIIGPANTPTSSVAAGVWRLRDAFNSTKNGTWPLTKSVATNSLRFNSSSSDYLSRTVTTTNRKTFTFSTWVKRSSLTSAYNNIYGANIDGNNEFSLRFVSSSDTLQVYNYISAMNFQLITTQVFRDISAWYHIVVAIDTTQATSSNRVRMYVNGSEITSFSTASYPTQNLDTMVNYASTTYNRVGSTQSSSSYFDGYMSEYYFIDGQQLTPSSFGASNASGVWYPIPYQGTYGTNGFYLKFANSASLGTDSSGNNNTWTVNNLTSVDQTTDTELNNFCTLNPLDTVPTNGPTFSNGNLTVSTSSTGTSPCRSTFCVDKGKWYWEIKKTSASSADTIIGIMEQSEAFNTYIGSTAKGYGYISTGIRVNNSTQVSYGATYTNGDIIGVALDMDNGTLIFYKNGSSQGTAYSSLSGLFSPAHSDGGTGTETADCNFGNPPYTGGSYTDGAGYGNFSYAVPSGYYALCTKNLNTYG